MRHLSASELAASILARASHQRWYNVEFGELRVCLEEICALFGLEKPSQEDVETSMKDLDKDMNGKVSSDEFEALIKKPVSLAHSDYIVDRAVRRRSGMRPPTSKNGRVQQGPSPPLDLIF